MPQLSDLSRRTGVPDRMLRFYLRMELLPALDESQEYDESHVRRVALVRTLLDVGGLSPAAIRQIVGRMDTSPPLHELLGAVQYALPSRGSVSQDQEWERAKKRTTALAEQRSWQVSPDNPAWQTLTQVLVTCEWLEQRDLPRLLETYAEALERVVDIEVQLLQPAARPGECRGEHGVRHRARRRRASALRRLRFMNISRARHRSWPKQTIRPVAGPRT